MRKSTLVVSKQFQNLMAYKKLAGPVPRILVLECGYWVDAACLNAIRILGWEAAIVQVPMQGIMPRETMTNFVCCITDFRPDFVLSVNLSGMDSAGLISRFLADLAIPHVTWFVDDPRTILMGNQVYGSDYAVALTWESAYVSYLKSLSFSVVKTLPLATDPVLFHGLPCENSSIPPTFIGNSMDDFSERESRWFEAYPELATKIDAAFNAELVTRHNFKRGMNAILGDDFARQMNSEEERHCELYCFIEGTRRLRNDMVKALTPLGLWVRGDDNWKKYTAQWGPGINYKCDLAHYYQACTVNLNSTSIQMATAVNQRVFDCPAAGGFLLTDHQSSLESLFDTGKEIITYQSLDECKELFKFYLNKPRLRQKVVLAARERILREHTYIHRMRYIVELVKQSFS